MNTTNKQRRITKERSHGQILQKTGQFNQEIIQSDFLMKDEKLR